jgi:hypothetical protein
MAAKSSSGLSLNLVLVDPQGEGALFYEVNNRGNKTAQHV